MKRARAAGLALVLVGCHLDPLPGPGPGPGPGATAGPTPLYPLPTDPPAPIAVPGPPPAPQRAAPPACDDGQVAVPGQWDWVGEWAWCPGYCALGQAGFAYVPPRYEGGVYRRGHFAATEGAGPQPGLRPAYRRYVHPPELVMGARQEPAPPPVVQAPAASEAPPPAPVYYLGGYGYGAHPLHAAPERARPRPQPGTGERPPAPPRGSGERP